MFLCPLIFHHNKTFTALSAAWSTLNTLLLSVFGSQATYNKICSDLLIDGALCDCKHSTEQKKVGGKKITLLLPLLLCDG